MGLKHTMVYLKHYFLIFLLFYAQSLVHLETKTWRGQRACAILNVVTCLIIDPDLFLGPLIDPVIEWIKGLF